MSELIGVALRVTIMYAFALTLVRLAGKRTIGDLSPLDFIVTLILGDMFDDFFWTEIPLSQAAVGMATIIGLHMFISYVTFKSRGIDRAVNSRPTQLVKATRVLRDGLRQARLSKEELYSDLRLQGEDSLADVDAAYLEPGGELSVLKRPQARPAQKCDLPWLRELYK